MKLYMTVLYFDRPDRNGDIIEAAGCEVKPRVRVTRDFRRGWMNGLGIAKLTKLSDRVVAEWDWPGGDMLPNIALYPAVAGLMEKVAARPLGGRVIKKCVIKEIGISPSPNQDETILSIQEQNPNAPIHWAERNPLDGLIKKEYIAEEKSEHVGPIEAQSEPPFPQEGSD